MAELVCDLHSALAWLKILTAEMQSTFKLLLHLLEVYEFSYVFLLTDFALVRLLLSALHAFGR